MDNQDRKIDGYRELNQGEIDLINRTKDLAKQCGYLVDEIMAKDETDKRSASVARTLLQSAFMWLNRSIAKPETFG